MHIEQVFSFKQFLLNYNTCKKTFQIKFSIDNSYSSPDKEGRSSSTNNIEVIIKVWSHKFVETLHGIRALVVEPRLCKLKQSELVYLASFFYLQWHTQLDPRTGLMEKNTLMHGNLESW